MKKLSTALALVWLAGCGQDDHPEYRDTIVTVNESGPIFVLIDYSYATTLGDVTTSDDALRTIDVATGDSSERVNLDRNNCFCAPATVGDLWCNCTAGEYDYRYELRRLSDLDIIVDNDRLLEISGGAFDPPDFMASGISITPSAHELIINHLEDATGEHIFYAVHPDTLDVREIDLLEEETIDNVESSESVRSIGRVGAYFYSIDRFDLEALQRTPADDPDAPAEVLNPSQTYDRGVMIVRDVFDARYEALSTADPESVFVVEDTEAELRISRVRTDDGVVSWTYRGDAGSVDAAAISGSTLGVVIVDPFVSEEVERAARVIGLSLESGAEIYRIEI